MIKQTLTALSICLALPAQGETTLSEASPETRAFVESNLLGIFYHELGHALIHIMELPIYGQEEDAADVLSVFLLDALYEEESAVQMAYDTAFGFLGEAENTDEVAYWDVHGPDLQRYYNLVCLFYGANPDEREDVAQDLGLPEERAEYCPEEFEQAAHSWGSVLDEISHPSGGSTLQLNDMETNTESGRITASVITTEVEALNSEIRLPETVKIDVVACDEANAFYDPQAKTITMCTEFAEALTDFAPKD